MLVRDKSEKFIESLKREMVENPTANVQPILCMVKLKEGEEFATNIKEAYQYYTIGGNNSREAIQQLLAEHPEFLKEKVASFSLSLSSSPLYSIL